MKILHYINNLGGGGAERLLSFLLPLLKERGHEIHLAYCNDKNNIKDFEKLIEDAEIPIHNFKLSPYSPLNITKLIQLNKRENFNIIHGHLFPTQYWLAFAKTKLDNSTILVKTEHNTDNRRRHYTIIKPLDKFVYSKYKKVIAITHEVKKSLDKWIDHTNKTILIPNGVSLDEVQNALDNYEPDVYQFLSKANMNILMVASFSGEAKDQLSLIKSLQFLPENYHLYLAGKGNLMLKAKEITKNLDLLNRVHFLGMRTDVYVLMNLVNINVLSSNYEGMSGVTLEGLASSKPFIGSDVPGINDIVPDRRFLFEKKNPNAIAEKIHKIVRDEALSQEMVSIANAHVEKFDITNMCNAYENLYLALNK